MSNHTDELEKELESAKKKHPYFPTDIIHMVSIMNEESGESTRAALNHKYENGKLSDLWDELIQTGAMVLRVMENIESKVIEEKDGQPELDIF